MAVLKALATEQLKVLCIFFLVGHFYRLPWAHPASACQSDLYLSVAVAQYYLFCATVPAFIILLVVRMKVNIAEAEFEDEADDAAGWRRVAMLLALGLSAAAGFLAIVAFEDGYRYRRGCADGPRSLFPMTVVLMVLMALMHGFIAWVAVFKG